MASPTVTATVPPSTLPDQHSVSVSVSECTGKSLKWPRPSDHKPTVQHQSTSTAADYQASEISKTTGATNPSHRKDKDNKPGRKFGLSLFRRNGGKKDKPKKEYVSFSGQFPPEEWPVRDEDDLNNLPRDLEHAIIKRINPELTVDNLTRHTVLMKKMEERRDRGVDKDETGVNKGMSTEILTLCKPRHHHSFKAGAGKRSAQKASRSKRRAHSSRDKQRDRERDRVRSKPPMSINDYPDGEDMIPTRLRVEIPVNEVHKVEEGEAVEGKYLYKKRIDNPFQTHPNKDPTESGVPPTIREHKRREVKEGKSSGSGRRERTNHRSKSWDPHRAKVGVSDGRHTGKSPTSEERYDCGRGFTADHLLQAGVRHSRELSLGYTPAYPQSCTLRIGDKVRHQREETSMESCEREGTRGLFQEVENNRQTSEGGTANTEQYIYTDATHPNEHLTKPSSDLAVPWPKPSLQRKHSLRLSNPQRDDSPCPDELSSHPLTSQSPVSRDQKQIGVITTNSREQRTLAQSEPVVDSPPALPDADAFVEDDYRLYQRADQQEDEDACSSLCLNEEEMIDSHQPRLVYQSYECDSNYPNSSFQPSQVARDAFSSLSAAQREAALGPSRPRETTRRLRPQWTRSDEVLEEAFIQEETWHEPSLDLDLHDTPDVANSSIFDYCQTSEIESDTETVRKSSDEGDGQSAHWAAEVEEMQKGDFPERGVPLTPEAGLSLPAGAQGAENGENQSITGDSGIDSPR